MLSDTCLVLGGAASGKSAFAENLVERQDAPLVYIASAQAWDAEMRAKIDTHVARRGPRWRTVEAPLDAAAEHAGTHLLGLWVHGPGMFHNSLRQIETPEDFQGLKVRVPGGYVAELAEELGVTTQFMGPGDVYEKMSTGVIDGVTFPAEALKAFNLSQHVKYAMEVPGGLYNTSWFMVMNEDRWNDLSEEDRAAISSVSGAMLAKVAGQVWNTADTAGLEDATAKGVTFYAAPAPVLNRVQEIAAAKEAAWAEAVAAQGFDGAAALAALREQAK